MRFRGGYRFSQFEGEASPTLTALPVPRSVVFPLDDPLIAGYAPVVTGGGMVRAGEPLFASGDSSWIIPASIGGTVSIDDNTLTITAGEDTTIVPAADHPREPWRLPHSERIALLTKTGANLLLGMGIDDAERFWTVTSIIVSTIHTSPLSIGWSPAIYGDTAMLATGVRLLGALFPKAAVTVAVTARHAASLDTPEITEYARVVTLSDRYPQEHPSLLARDIAGITVDPLPNPAALVLDESRVVQLAEVLTGVRPLIDRTVCLAGPGVSRPGWHRIRIGSTIESVLAAGGKGGETGPWRTINGNPLSGIGVEDLLTPVWYDMDELSVISEHAVRDLFRFLSPGLAHDSYARATVSSVLPLFKRKIEANLHGGERPCVQCNYCDEVCPVGIYPFLIWKYVQADKTDESFRLHPETCIGCGLCDYVCPSKIAITAGVETAKQAVLDARRDHETD